MSDLKIQGEVSLDTSSTDQAFARVEEGAKKMSRTVSQSGKDAAAGTSAIGEGAESSAEKFTRAESQIAAAIQRRSALLSSAGQGERAYQEARIKNAGLDVAKFEPYLKQLDDAVAKQKEASGSLDTMGMSAKQLQANLRGVPAQFTDIITSLQGGQRPLTVLMQQGGQLKDMFGGVGPAAKALGGYIAGLISPLSLAAGAAAALAYAYEKGSSEARDYNKALILTGNSAGTTANSLSDMAGRISVSTGATIGLTASTLTEIVSSGKISADVMGRVAQAAIEMERSGGAAVSETVKQFAELGNSPVEGILKLNGQYHFLTASVYEQIKALEEQGKTADAAKLAQTTYANAINEMIPALKQNLGVLESSWQWVGDAAKGAWDKMVGIGRSDSLEIQLEKAKRASESGYFASSEFGVDPSGIPDRSKINQLYNDIESRDQATLIQMAANRTREEALAGIQVIDELKKSLRTKEELIADSNKKIARNAAAVNAATPGTYSDKDIANLQKAAADQIRGKQPETGKSQLSFDIESIKKSADAELSVYSNAEKIMQSMRSANLVSDKDYYESKAGFIKLLASVQEEELQKELARMRQEKLSGKDKIENDKKILDTEAKLAKLRSDTTTSLTINSIQAEGAIRKVAQATDDARSSAEAYLRAVERQNQRTLSGIGMGNRYRTEQNTQNQIEDKFISRKQTLDDDLRRNQVTKETYDAYLEIARDTYEKEVSMHADTRAKILAKEADWKNGMTEALANYADTARNVMQQTADLFTSALKGAEDAWVRFAQTGKLSFSDLSNTVIGELARMQFKAAASPLTSGLSGWLSGLFGESSYKANVASMQNEASNELAALSGARASGGPVSSGGTYLIGEKGPELLTMGGNGYVTPNSALGGGQTIEINQTIRVDARSDMASILRAMNAAKEAAKSEILDSMRRGGAFARA